MSQPRRTRGRNPFPTKITTREAEAFRRFMLQMPHGKDMDLVVLKAHLLIEEQVNELIRTRLPSPGEFLKDQHFHSAGRIRLAKATFPSPTPYPWVWQALKLLTTVRNHVAHKIDPAGRDAQIEELVATASTFAEPTDSLQLRFEAFAFTLFVHVSGLVDGEESVSAGQPSAFAAGGRNSMA